MSRLDVLIEINGAAAEIHRNTGSAFDSYQDIIPSWAKVADEYVWIQDRNKDTVNINEAGREDLAEILAFCLSDSVVQDLDIIKIGSTEYEVRKIVDKTSRGGDTNHKEADVRLIQEGS